MLSIDFGDKIDEGAKFRGHFAVLQPDDVPRAGLDLVV
jgi:hypothetical protein